MTDRNTNTGTNGNANIIVNLLGDVVPQAWWDERALSAKQNMENTPTPWG
jgi:hypothetical protein